MYLYLCLVFVFICKKQPTLLSWWSRGISIWIFLVFVFVFVSDICIYFCPHGKSSPYCFFGGAREGKADYLQSPNVSYKMCCFIIFWLFENLQPWSWGYNWGRAPTSNILRLVGCTRKHMSNIRWCLFQIMFMLLDFLYFQVAPKCFHIGCVDEAHSVAPFQPDQEYRGGKCLQSLTI